MCTIIILYPKIFHWGYMHNVQRNSISSKSKIFHHYSSLDSNEKSKGNDFRMSYAIYSQKVWRTEMATELLQRDNRINFLKLKKLI